MKQGYVNNARILYRYDFWRPASHCVPHVTIPALAPVAQCGFLGVPIFFAINTFVVAHSAEGRSPVDFAVGPVPLT